MRDLTREPGLLAGEPRLQALAVETHDAAAPQDGHGGILLWERVDLSRGVIRLEVTKSGRRREVPLNEDSYRALVSLEPKAEGRIFRTRDIRSAFETALEKAKLEDVTLHTLRHTFASWAVMRGVTLPELKDLLGHATLTMTMRYAHLAPEHLRPSPPKRSRMRSRKSCREGTLLQK